MRRFLTLCVVLMFSEILAFAQSRLVTGTVTDDKGTPIEGASVRVKGAKSGTAADANGKFSISVPSGATLIFSGVGLTPQEVAVGGQSVVDVSLVRTAGSELSTITITTALGQSTSKVKTGYATTTFNNEQINRASPANLLDA